MLNKYDFEYFIRDWVRDNFGDSEAEQPSWSIELLAEYLADKLKAKQEYNGWSNYATWRVNLELLDSEAEAIHESGETFKGIAALADHLKDMVQDAIDLSQESNVGDNQVRYDFVAAYASAFVDEVNYYEIAENMAIDNPEFIEKAGK